MRILNRIQYRFAETMTNLHKKGTQAALRALSKRVLSDLKGMWHRTGVRLRSRNGLVLENINGIRMYLSVDDPGISRQLLKQGIREPAMTKLIEEQIKPGMIGLDVGANIGYYALLEALLVQPNGKIIAIEPVPENVRILRLSCEVNDFKNIEICPYAASDMEGEASLSLPDALNLGSMLTKPGDETSEVYRQLHANAAQIVVPTVTIDSLLTRFDLERVDFVRMDVEGFEIVVTNGMIGLLSDRGRSLKLFVEVHNMIFQRPEVLLHPWIAQLQNWGFEPRALIRGDRLDTEWTVDTYAAIVSGERRGCLTIFLERP